MTLLLYFWTFVWDFHWFLLSILTGKIDLTGSLIRCWNLPGTLLGFHWNVNNRWSVSVIKTIQLQVISPTLSSLESWESFMNESCMQTGFPKKDFQNSRTSERVLYVALIPPYSLSFTICTGTYRTIPTFTSNINKILLLIHRHPYLVLLHWRVIQGKWQEAILRTILLLSQRRFQVSFLSHRSGFQVDVWTFSQ